jgi:hypothetical protein
MTDIAMAIAGAAALGFALLIIEWIADDEI